MFVNCIGLLFHANPGVTAAKHEKACPWYPLVGMLRAARSIKTAFSSATQTKAMGWGGITG